MFKKLLIVSVIVSLLLSGCLVLATNEGRAQTCPAWAKLQEVKCDIKIWKGVVNATQNVNLTDWEAMRITFVGREMLFLDGKNIVVTRDTGESVDYTTLRITPGTYVIEKINNAKPASFKMLDYDTSIVINFTAELVRPTTTK